MSECSMVVATLRYMQTNVLVVGVDLPTSISSYCGGESGSGQGNRAATPSFVAGLDG